MKLKEIVSEVHIFPNYTKAATMDKAKAQMGAAFGRDEAEREKDLARVGRRERGLARHKARADKFWADKQANDANDAIERDRANKHGLEAELAKLHSQFDPDYEYSDDYGVWKKHKNIHGQINSLKSRLAKISETATVGATSAANIGTVVSPQLSPGKARGKKSYTGSIATGSGTKAPPQPKVVQPKKADGTAVNGLDVKGNLFGGPAVKR
jgi:hypothetical protein